MAESSLIHAEVRSTFKYDAVTGALVKLSKRSGDKLVGEPSEANRYGRVCFKGERTVTQRFVWFLVFGVWPDFGIDHIDRDTSNNALSNLRDVPQEVNNRNAKLNSHNKSGHNGVYRRNGLWVAQIGRKTLGRFVNLDEAVYARNAANIKYGFHTNHGRAR